MKERDLYAWFKVLWQCYERSKRTLVLALLLSGVAIALEAASPLLTKAIFDRALPDKDILLLAYLGAGWAAILASASVLRYVYSYSVTKADCEAVSWLRTLAFKAHLLEFSEYGETERTHGERLSRILRDPEALVAESGAKPLLSIVMQAAGLVVVCVLACYLDWQLTLISLASGAAAMLSHSRTPKAVKDSNRELASVRAEVTSVIDNLIAAWRIIVRCGRLTEEVDCAMGEFGRLAKRDINAQKKKYVAFLRNSLLLDPIPVALIVVAAYRMMIGAISLGTLVAFFSYAGMINSSLTGLFTNLVKMWSGYGQTKDCVKVISSILAEQGDLAAASRKEFPERESVRTIEIAGLVIAVGAHTVSADRLDFRRGKTYLFTGDSGAGKTLFLEFLAGIRRCAGGDILLNGRRIAAAAYVDVARRCGYVGKDEVLLNRSVLKNVKYGLSGDDGGGEWQAWLARLRMDFSSRDSVTGLSAGEKQRVSFVRELLRRPQVFIVDEGLDSLEQELGQDALRLLRDILPDAILIICTHNWRRQLPIDNVLTVSSGRITQQEARLAPLSS